MSTYIYKCLCDFYVYMPKCISICINIDKYITKNRKKCDKTTKWKDNIINKFIKITEGISKKRKEGVRYEKIEGSVRWKEKIKRDKQKKIEVFNDTQDETDQLIESVNGNIDKEYFCCDLWSLMFVSCIIGSAEPRGEFCNFRIASCLQ